jgi:hypothetical protein
VALKVISVAASLVAVASCGAAAVAAVAARQSLAPASRKRYDIVPLSVTDEEIELRATSRTSLERMNRLLSDPLLRRRTILSGAA